MRRCPQCRRDYYDETLAYCLDDGAHLVDGPASDDPAIATVFGPSSEAPTKSFEPPRNDAVTDEGTNDDKATIAKSSKKGILILSLAVVLIGSAFFAYRYLPFAGSEIDSIAVLPFENGSGDPNMDYLSDGVSESVIDRLSGLSQLKVIARSSSFKYRGQNLDLKEIADALGVRAIVTGRVLQRGDGYVIRVDLTDTLENKQLWGENFSRKAADLELLQSDISREIADNLRVRFSGAQVQQLASRRTPNPQAYELLLKGRYHTASRVGDNPEKAVEYFEQAVSLDPNYALAQAHLAGGYLGLLNFHRRSPIEFMPKIEAAARRALELDSNLAEAHHAMAIFRSANWDWAAAESGFNRAIELNPNFTWPHLAYSNMLSRLGRHDEAIAEARRARELDPVSALSSNFVFAAQMWARRYEQALEGVNGQLESDPNNLVVRWLRAEIYSEKGMNREAIEEWNYLLGRGAIDPAIDVHLGAVYAKVGEREKAIEILNRFETGEYAPPTYMAVLYTALGDREQALASLDKAYSARDPRLREIGVLSSFDPLRSEPRFRDLLRLVGLPQ